MDHSEYDKRFYVYLHIDNLGHIRYIGSGTAGRYKSKVDRSKEHIELWDSLDKIKIKENLSSNYAKDLEQYLINDFKESVFLLNKKLNVCKTKEYKWEYFEKYLEYSEDSPSGLVWKISPSSNINAGEVAGTLGNKGYWNVGIRGSYYRNHRVIYALCTKTDLPPEEAKQRAFDDAVAFRKQIEENLYEPINKMLEELYNSSKSVLGL